MQATATAPRLSHLPVAGVLVPASPRPTVTPLVSPSRTIDQPGKRVLDLALAVPMLLVALPILLVCAAVIKLTDGGPVLFRQRRVGHGGRNFTCLKLRSMYVDAEDRIAEVSEADVTDGLLFRVDDDPRVTRIGRLIRRTGIDELPQLWHVITGEMSLVGPRPLAAALDDFTPRERTRHMVLPGLTGLWQVSGGNDLPWEEMIELDLDYAARWSVWSDLKILFLTVPALVNRVGPS